MPLPRANGWTRGRAGDYGQGLLFGTGGAGRLRRDAPGRRGKLHEEDPIGALAARCARVPALRWREYGGAPAPAACPFYPTWLWVTASCTGPRSTLEGPVPVQCSCSET